MLPFRRPAGVCRSPAASSVIASRIRIPNGAGPDQREEAAEAGRDLSKIHSVASFFVSRVDAEVDKRLAAAGRTDLQSKTAIANALVAYGAFEEVFGSDRFKALAAKGANQQRPLWASTGTKDPSLPDTLYVTNLVADGVVNTMPEKTMDAFADHGEVGESIVGRAAEGRAVLDDADIAGVTVYYSATIITSADGIFGFGEVVDGAFPAEFGDFIK